MIRVRAEAAKNINSAVAVNKKLCIMDTPYCIERGETSGRIRSVQIHIEHL